MYHPVLQSENRYKNCNMKNIQAVRDLHATYRWCEQECNSNSCDKSYFPQYFSLHLKIEWFINRFDLHILTNLYSGN